MKSSLAPNGLNPVGWYVAVIIERFEYYDEDVSNPERECLAHENLVLIQAATANQAFEHAVEMGRACEGFECTNDVTGRTGEWKFVGLSELLPVYDALEHGAEIMWTKHEDIAVSTVEDMVMSKAELGAFRQSISESE